MAKIFLIAYNLVLSNHSKSPVASMIAIPFFLCSRAAGALQWSKLQKQIARLKKINRSTTAASYGVPIGHLVEKLCVAALKQNRLTNI